MNRSNAPSPIHTSTTPTSGGSGGGSGGYYNNNPPPSNDFFVGHHTREDYAQRQEQDSNNYSSTSHEQHHYYSSYDDNGNNVSGYDNDSNANAIEYNNNMMMSTPSAMRQGRFSPGPTEPTSSVNTSMNSISAAGQVVVEPQLQPQISQQQQQQQQFNAASSQVTFHSGAAPPQPTSADTLQNMMMMMSSSSSPSNNFMFDEMEDFQHYLNHNNNDPTTNTSFNNDPTTTNNGGIPTEGQLTLLCLDYLRSLRRSYNANPQDLYHGEGLDADYLSLAIWSLSRAFVSPGKLKFGEARGSMILEECDEDEDVDGGGAGGGGKKGKKKKSSKGGEKKIVKEICIVGGGGLAGVEDECVGNDSVYRLDVRKKLDQDGTAVLDNNNNNSSDIDTSSKEVFALTKDIKLPSMTDITNEVLLSYNNNNKDDDNNNNAVTNDEEESPIYEQNDMHLSNSHRFYLFNGMASGDDSQGMMGGAATSPKKNAAAAGPSIIDGGPLTLTDLTSVALSTLNAKSRIEAEREVVSDPLFESFIKAASEKGFFNESKLEGKDTLSPEAEEHRQRLLYENKYRKVVAKFRSKLAVREEQQMMLHHGVGVGGGGWSPRSGQRAMINVHSVSDRLEMRRDRIIDEVKEYRVEEEEDAPPFVPHSLCEEREQQQQQQQLLQEQLLLQEQQQHQLFVDAVAGYVHEKQIVRELVSPRRLDSEEGILQANDVMEEAELMTEDEGFIPMSPSSPVEAPPTPVASPSSPPVVEALPSPLVGSRLSSPPKTTTTIDSPPVASHNISPPTKMTAMDPPSNSPEIAATTNVPPSPAAKLPFYQEAESINAQGNELMQKKQFSQALELYTRALKISPAGPNSHTYYSNRSAAHLSLGDAESSIQDSQLALTIRPDYAKAHSRLGLAHYASGRYQEAVEYYEAALGLEPDNEWVKKKYDKARKMLAKVQHEKEDEVVVTEDKEGGDWASPFAGTIIDEVAKRKGVEIVRQADEYKDSGNAFMKDKNFEEALNQYNIAIGISPDGPNSHIYYSNRAAAYCYLGQYSEAADDCLSSIELDDTYEKAYSRYGLSLFFLGDFEGSINAYRKSLELAPDNKASLSYLAKAKARLAVQQENEMQEYMAKKLNEGFRQEKSVDGREEEIENDMHGDESFIAKNGLSQSRDDDGEGIEASYNGMKVPGQVEKGFDPPGEIMNSFSPFDEDEGDEI